jgi:hypothetical protein
MPCEKISESGSSLIDCAIRTSHAVPEMTAASRPIHASQASARRTKAGRRALLSVLQNAGSAMKTLKIAAPATVMVAAK